MRVSRRIVGPATVTAAGSLRGDYRLLARTGMDDKIFTHVTARVPGPDHHLLINPYGFFFSEVGASNLVKFDLDGNIVGESPYTINPVGFVFHTAIHRVRADVTCVAHTHSRAAVAVSALKGGLLPLTQSAMRFYGRVAYHDYEGLMPEAGELDRIAREMGDKRVMILRNHGMLTAGRSIPEAFHLAHYLEQCCRTQLDILAAGRELALPPESVCQKAADQFAASKYVPGEREWPALLRLLDREDADFRE